ncbi:MAG TPA: helix-turn-helix transcriptional regulator [Capsulimonadaceae bacterium]|jgi:AraC-like DNA-binding protein
MNLDIEVASVGGHGVALYPPCATFGPRNMRDWEFVWLIQGDAVYRWGDDEVSAPEGSIVLCRPGGVDYFRWDETRRTRHAYFHFSVSGLPSDWSDGWPLVRCVVPGDILVTLFQHVLTLAGSGDDRQIGLAVATMLAAFRTDRRTADIVERENWPAPVERGLDYIYKSLEADSTQAISLAEIAHAAHVTPEHLCRVFQSALGHSPARTVRLARLDRAATLIARSNYSIGEIAELCGFANPFHFSRCFRAAFGKSPTEIRAQIVAGDLPPLPLLLAHLM